MPRLPFLFDPHPIDSNLDKASPPRNPSKIDGLRTHRKVDIFVEISTMQLPSTALYLSKTIRTAALEVMLSAHTLLYPNSTNSPSQANVILENLYLLPSTYASSPPTTLKTPPF
jgi:hypothetical protein